MSKLDAPSLAYILSGFFETHAIKAQPVAVGVSGGPDSMALLKALSSFAEQAGQSFTINALIVDHGLRSESGEEASKVYQQVKNWPQVRAHILRWDQQGVDSRVQEEARAARYDLMHGFCQEQGIDYLFLGHHKDDQAETFLFRLAKGSGLEGLCAMQELQPLNDTSVFLARPFLHTSKEVLVRFCKAMQLPFIEDPSNHNEKFARARLRQSWQVLAEEGLTTERLATTISRLRRAQQALDIISDNIYSAATKTANSKQIVLDIVTLKSQPYDIGYRVLVKAMNGCAASTNYGPRMQKMETLALDIFAPAPFRKRTLGGVVFERDDERGVIILSAEA